MTEGKTQIEQIRDVLETLRLSDQVKLTTSQYEKIAYIGRMTLDALLGLESK